jgi:hypothetical protein
MAVIPWNLSDLDGFSIDESDSLHQRMVVVDQVPPYFLVASRCAHGFPPLRTAHDLADLRNGLTEGELVDARAVLYGPVVQRSLYAGMVNASRHRYQTQRR